MKHVLILLAMILVGCAGGQPENQEEPVLETVDLPADVVIDPDTDPRAPSQRARLGGVLPGGFPGDLPIFLPATVADLGEDASGDWVAFDSPVDATTVIRRLKAQVAGAGWDGGVGEGSTVLRKGDRTAELTIEATAGGGTRYRYRYRPGG